MVKKIKRFVLFVLFSMVFQLIHNKIQGGENSQGLKLVPSAEAKCCPKPADPFEPVYVDWNGTCCSCIDENGNCGPQHSRKTDYTKCCPKEVSDHLDSNGNCCPWDKKCEDKDGNCCDCDNCY